MTKLTGVIVAGGALALACGFAGGQSTRPIRVVGRTRRDGRNE